METSMVIASMMTNAVLMLFLESSMILKGFGLYFLMKNEEFGYAVRAY